MSRPTPLLVFAFIAFPHLASAGNLTMEQRLAICQNNGFHLSVCRPFTQNPASFAPVARTSRPTVGRPAPAYAGRGNSGTIGCMAGRGISGILYTIDRLANVDDVLGYAGLADRAIRCMR